MARPGAAGLWLSALLACAATAGAGEAAISSQQWEPRSCGPCHDREWESPSLAKCDFWGGPHFSRSFFGKAFDAHGVGVHKIASACNGSFAMQSFLCPLNGKESVVAIGFAIRVDGKRVVLMDGQGYVDGQEVTGKKPPGVYYAGSLSHNSGGVQVLSADGCVRVNVNRKIPNGHSMPAWLHNVKLRIGKAALEEEGLCGSTSAGEVVPNDSEDMIFTRLELQKLCDFCGAKEGSGRVPLNCLPPTHSVHVVATREEGTSATQTCGEGGRATLARAQEACQSLAKGSFEYESCLVDFCSWGGDLSAADNVIEEQGRKPDDAAQCTERKGKALSAFYPCGCGRSGDSVCSEGELCYAAFGACTGPPIDCSIKSSRYPDSMYPCLCGKSVCDTDEVCTLMAEDGECTKLATCGQAISKVPCRCGRQLCRRGEFCGGPGRAECMKAPMDVEPSTAVGGVAGPQAVQDAGMVAQLIGQLWRARKQAETQARFGGLGGAWLSTALMSLQSMSLPLLVAFAVMAPAMLGVMALAVRVTRRRRYGCFLLQDGTKGPRQCSLEPCE